MDTSGSLLETEITRIGEAENLGFPEKISKNIMIYLAERGIAEIKDIRGVKGFRAEICEAVYFILGPDTKEPVYVLKYIDEYKQYDWLRFPERDFEEKRTEFRSALEEAISSEQ